MAQPYWWFKNQVQDAKNARCSRWIVVGFFFTFIVTLKIKSEWKKVSLFNSKEVKMLEVYKLSKLSIVHYTIAVGIDISFSPSIHHCHSINIAIH